MTGRSRETAIRAAFEDHYTAVHRAAFGILADGADAEDVAQESFVRLHRRGPLDRPSDEVRAWLLRTATNRALGVLRSRARREARQLRARFDDDEPEDPAVVSERRDEVRAVRQALSDVRERDAALLLLRHAGLRYREIASVLGVAPGSVGTLLARAEAAFEEAYAARERGGTGGSA